LQIDATVVASEILRGRVSKRFPGGVRACRCAVAIACVACLGALAAIPVASGDDSPPAGTTAASVSTAVTSSLPAPDPAPDPAPRAPVSAPRPARSHSATMTATGSAPAAPYVSPSLPHATRTTAVTPSAMVTAGASSVGTRPRERHAVLRHRRQVRRHPHLQPASARHDRMTPEINARARSQSFLPPTRSRRPAVAASARLTGVAAPRSSGTSRLVLALTAMAALLLLAAVVVPSPAAARATGVRVDGEVAWTLGASGVAILIGAVIAGLGS
jgi:hypothetical protein